MNSAFFDIWPNVVAGLIVLIIHGLLASCELSLFKLRYARMSDAWREVLDKFPGLAPLLEETERAIRAIRFCQAGAIIFYAVLWVPLFAHSLGQWEIYWLGQHTVVSWLAGILLALLLHQMVAEALPRALGLAFPITTLRLSSAVLVVFEWLSRPFHGGLHRLSQLVWRLTIRDRKWPSLDGLGFEAQLESLGQTDGDKVLQQILKNAVSIRGLVVSDVLLPRNQVKYFNLFDSVPENLKMARECGHTRFPLCQGDLDRCIGLIHIKDLFRYAGDLNKVDLRHLKREIIRIDIEEPLESALSKLLVHKMHMALVIDEFRGTEGVLTLERILEQLVGEIQDEFDQEEEVRIRPLEEGGAVVISGLTAIHDLERAFDMEIENDTVSTLGGLITSEIGRIPELGEVLTVEGLSITITQVDETRVIEAQVRKLSAEELEAEAES